MTYTKQELDEILRLHGLWLNGDPNGNRANLTGADLTCADLTCADFEKVKGLYFQIPQEGELVVYKKLQKGIAKLKIPSEAKRTATPIGRKCRAEFAFVLELQCGESYDNHTGTTLYKQGEMVYPDKYNNDWRVECTNGIHFFLTRQEAEDY